MAMKNDLSKTNTYKILFTKTVIILAISVIVLCVASLAVSIYQLTRFGIGGFTDYLKYPFLMLISVFCIVLVISILAKSQYVVTDRYLISQYGFIKSRFDVKKITAITLDTDTNKLTLNIGEQYCMITTAKEWNEELVRALLKINPNIDYSFTLPTKSEDKK